MAEKWLLFTVQGVQRQKFGPSDICIWHTWVRKQSARSIQHQEILLSRQHTLDNPHNKQNWVIKKPLANERSNDTFVQCGQQGSNANQHAIPQSNPKLVLATSQSL